MVVHLKMKVQSYMRPLLVSNEVSLLNAKKKKEMKYCMLGSNQLLTFLFVTSERSLADDRVFISELCHSHTKVQACKVLSYGVVKRGRHLLKASFIF